MKNELKALIVDDEEDIGLMVSLILKKEGIYPTYINRVAPAKALINEKLFDFYFLDLNLPDGTGFDLIPSIREKNKDSKIIIISAYDGHLETTKAEGFEVTFFVKKPFTKKDILEAIQL
jgi:DNA-binding response OmpR family regulator